MYKRGMVFGTFDGLHYGHIRLLRRASALCEELCVITESDEMVREAKGVNVTTKKQRMDDLSAVKYVDCVLCRTKRKDRKYWVDIIKPDVLFLGGDWKNKDWVGKHYGIKIHYLPRTEGVSSTIIRNGISRNISKN